MVATYMASDCFGGHHDGQQGDFLVHPRTHFGGALSLTFWVSIFKESGTKKLKRVVDYKQDFSCDPLHYNLINNFSKVMFLMFFLCSGEKRALMAELILTLVRESRNTHKSTARREWKLRPFLKEKKNPKSIFTIISSSYGLTKW